MPIHLPPINRRRFLAGTLGAGAGLLVPRGLAARDQTPDPNYFILLADTHIPALRDGQRHGVKPVETFEQTVQNTLSLDFSAAGIIIAGDCAFLHGESGDYAMLGELIVPWREAGIPVHFALGNHDHRGRFLAAFPDATSHNGIDPKSANKYVSMLETPHANWFMLDSLDQTDVVSGRLGEWQLGWLAQVLDAHPDKPALLVAHHNLDRTGKSSACLADTEALLELIVPRKQVKAFFHGHTHCWNVAMHQGLHLVNVPATAWLFDPTQPRGFITIRLQPDGMTLVLNTLDRRHAKHGEKIDLTWRT